MKKLIYKLLLFLTLILFFGEVSVRILKLNNIPPLIYQDKATGLPKYKPNQRYIFPNGNEYIIGKNGNTGNQQTKCSECPTISVIGDSYIEALMNPNSCHQSVLLQKLLPKYNFTSRAISGANFIQMLEMAKDLDSEQIVKQHLLYVHYGDFTESIDGIKNENQFRINLLDQKIIPPVFNSRTFYIKHYIAKFTAFPYFIYRKSLSGKGVNNEGGPSNQKLETEKISALIKAVKNDYDFSKITLILTPDTDQSIDKILKNHQIMFLRLRATNYKKWSHIDDSHWSCVGHKKAAQQVSNYLENNRAKNQ
jgi:hypothetical protein